jgi:ribonuclease HI
MLTLRFDGLYRAFSEERNPNSCAGVMCYGWVIERDGKAVARGHGGYARRVDASSNSAEYLALIEGLSALGDMHCEQEPIEVIGDARSVIEQMQGRAAVNSASVRSLYRWAVRLAVRYKHLSWTWTPRRMNQEADLLTRRAMRQIAANPTQYRAAIRAVEDPSIPRCKHGRLLSLLDLRIYQPLGLSV